VESEPTFRERAVPKSPSVTSLLSLLLTSSLYKHIQIYFRQAGLLPDINGHRPRSSSIPNRRDDKPTVTKAKSLNTLQPSPPKYKTTLKRASSPDIRDTLKGNGEVTVYLPHYNPPSDLKIHRSSSHSSLPEMRGRASSEGHKSEHVVARRARLQKIKQTIDNGNKKAENLTSRKPPTVPQIVITEPVESSDLVQVENIETESNEEDADTQEETGPTGPVPEDSSTFGFLSRALSLAEGRPGKWLSLSNVCFS